MIFAFLFTLFITGFSGIPKGMDKQILLPVAMVPGGWPLHPDISIQSPCNKHYPVLAVHWHCPDWPRYQYPTPRSVPFLPPLAPCHQFFSGRIHRTVAHAEGHGLPVTAGHGSDRALIDRRWICRGHRMWELELLDECRPRKSPEFLVSAGMLRHPFYHRSVFPGYYLHPMAIPLS